MTNDNESFFGEVISSYSSEQAVEDGFLMPNIRQHRFPDCNLITTSLWERIEKLASDRNNSRIFAVEPDELLGSLMLYAASIYYGDKFKGDNDRDFFKIPATSEGIVVWFVRNETGKLTAMLPEDY